MSPKAHVVENWMREWGRKFEIFPFSDWESLARAAANAYREELPLATLGEACASAFVRERAEIPALSWAGAENKSPILEAARAEIASGSVSHGLPARHWTDLRSSWAVWLLGAPPVADSNGLALTGLAWAAALRSESARDVREKAAMGQAWLSRMAFRSEWACAVQPDRSNGRVVDNGASEPEGAGELADSQSVEIAARLLCVLGERAQSSALAARRVEADALMPSLAEFMELMGADWMRLPDGALAVATQGMKKWVAAGASVDAHEHDGQKAKPLSALRMCARIGAVSDFAPENHAWKKEKRALAEWLVEQGASLVAQEPGGFSVLSDWCDASACEDWDSEWPLVVARLAAGTDVNAPDGAGWTPLARLAGAALHWPAKHWEGDSQREPLRWALQMAEALITEGANPSPRLPGGGRLASWEMLDPQWRDFLNSHLQARALAGVLSHRRLPKKTQKPTFGKADSTSLSNGVAVAESTEKEERRGGARRL